MFDSKDLKVNDIIIYKLGNEITLGRIISNHDFDSKIGCEDLEIIADIPDHYNIDDNWDIVVVGEESIESIESIEPFEILKNFGDIALEDVRKVGSMYFV